MSEPFAENLRLLCSHYASVAEVCRRIGINRQQFNKYLSGASTPSLHSLRRIWADPRQGRGALRCPGRHHREDRRAFSRFAS
jgi:hypothetical protein